MSVVVGLDLSLTSTGVVVASGGRLDEVGNVTSKGRASDTYADHMVRIREMCRQIWVLSVGAHAGRPDLAVIESPSYGSKFGSSHERAGLWWAVYDRLSSADIPVATVAPPTLKKYVTGGGRADKETMLAHAIEQYVRTPGPRIVKHDEADAAGLAAMGARRLGEPIELRSVSANQLDAMDGAKWPAS